MSWSVRVLKVHSYQEDRGSGARAQVSAPVWRARPHGRMAAWPTGSVAAAVPGEHAPGGVLTRSRAPGAPRTSAGALQQTAVTGVSPAPARDRRRPAAGVRGTQPLMQRVAFALRLHTRGFFDTGSPHFVRVPARPPPVPTIGQFLVGRLRLPVSAGKSFCRFSFHPALLFLGSWQGGGPRYPVAVAY